MPAEPRMYVYTVARDYGFAPNPFFGFCTLATCKPITRRVAEVGNWIVGTGSGREGVDADGKLVFAMKVSEALSFQEYWEDPRFFCKRPDLYKSKMHAFGDNIYHKDDQDNWVQERSHHSRPDFSKDTKNLKNDVQTDRILIAEEFVYFGAEGPDIPNKFRNYKGHDMCITRNHRVDHPDGLVSEFLDWLSTIRGSGGYQGRPRDWDQTA